MSDNNRYKIKNKNESDERSDEKNSKNEEKREIYFALNFNITE
jgi:hypothetical protein